jgi:uncharacterized protein YjbI with pentapeptide repeats
VRFIPSTLLGFPLFFWLLLSEGGTVRAEPSREETAAESSINRLGGTVIRPKYEKGKPKFDAVTLKEDDTPVTVTFANTELTDAQFASLSTPLRTINPQKLDLRFTHLRGAAVDGSPLWNLLDLPQLDDLDLSSTLVDAADLQGHLNHFARLTRLRLNYNSLLLKGLSDFIHNSSHLKLHLYLSHVEMRDADGRTRMKADEWLRRLASNKDAQANTILIGLDLSHNRLTDKGLEVLKSEAGRTAFPKLKELILAGNPDITDGGLSFLQDEDRAKTIKDLDLSDTQLSNFGIPHLFPYHDLTSLSLANTIVTDAGIEDLLTNNGKLTTLDLSRTATLRKPEICSRLGALKKLRSLNISGTGITDEGLRVFWEGQLADLSLLTEAQQQNIADSLQCALEDLPRRYHPGVLNVLSVADTSVSVNGLLDRDIATGVERGVRFPHLSTILTGGTSITDGALSHWKALRSNIDIPQMDLAVYQPPVKRERERGTLYAPKQ